VNALCFRDSGQDRYLFIGSGQRDFEYGGGLVAMSDLFKLSERQVARVSPFFQLLHGMLRVDDRRVISGIIYVTKHGLQWKDAAKAYGPHETLYNRFVRWSRLGVFDRIFRALATAGGKPERIMIDAHI
jgi:transposase